MTYALVILFIVGGGATTTSATVPQENAIACEHAQRIAVKQHRVATAFCLPTTTEKRNG